MTALQIGRGVGMEQGGVSVPEIKFNVAKCRVSLGDDKQALTILDTVLTKQRTQPIEPRRVRDAPRNIPPAQPTRGACPG